MHTIFLEEFAKGCDIVSHESFRQGRSLMKLRHRINRIRDSVDELIRVSGDSKKTLLILWWWWPKKTKKELIDPTLYTDSFNLKKEDVDGIGAWNFSSGGDPITARLDTYSTETQAVWREVIARNSEFNPPS